MDDSKPVCLIVDDDPDTRWALEHVLWQEGLLSQQAANGRLALEKIRQRRYALVLLDAKLPDTDGLELAERISAVDPKLKLILISGYFYPDDAVVRSAQSSGLIQDFIPKPFVHGELKRAVARTLALRAGSTRSGTGAME